jgi:ABC-2 type transport system ATP-binding protein
MKMLAGFLTPSSGRASICGFDVVEASLEAKRHLGYLPEGAPAYPDMTPLAFLGFIARVRGYAGSQATKRVAEAIERVELAEVLHQPIETLSKGFKRRVGLAQALLHDPAVLILDEPTDGLDPNQKYDVRRLIQVMAPDKAIIISTHILEEVDAVCSRAVVIAHGKLLADAVPTDLIARARTHNAVYLKLAGPVGAELMQAMAACPIVELVEQPDPEAMLVIARAGQPISEDVRSILRSHSAPVVEFRVERGRLDDVFRDITLARAS